MLRLIGTWLLFGLFSYSIGGGRELHPRLQPDVLASGDRDSFVDAILANLTVPELIHQLHLVYAPNVAVSLPGMTANETYDDYVGNQGIGVIHELYPTNASQYNSLQLLNSAKMRVPIPFMQTGECLHAIGSSKGTVFPQQLGMAATFDPDLVYRVGRALGSEARAIGIHACFSPVLDLGKDSRWGRIQEDFGEDMVLTSIMGASYAKGLSKNSTWSDPDAVIPVMKHFAAHGSPTGGLNAGPFLGYGSRQIMSEMLRPFKAAVQLGGARGVMMAYHDIDGIPATVNPDLYQALSDMGFDGFVIADETAMQWLVTQHFVASSPADAISQWLNAGGQVQFFDYTLDVFQETIVQLVNNGTVHLATLKERVRGVLNAKWDLGLFNNSLVPEGINATALADSEAHRQLALEAAQSTLVLLENRNGTLPLDTSKVKSIALVGPFVDATNYGDYAGAWGETPVNRATTVRAGMENYTAKHGIELVTRWGANSWLYNGQYPIPPDLLSTTDGMKGGLRATYFADLNFSEPVFQLVEPPNRDWGLYPPNGLPNLNFSVTYEGNLRVVSDVQMGWIGAVVGANSTAKLFVDEKLIVDIPSTISGNSLSDVLPLSYSQTNGTAPPPGSASFQFKANTSHAIRLEFQAWGRAKHDALGGAQNAELQLFWNLVDAKGTQDTVTKAGMSDLIVFVGGGAANSDAESGDRATMDLAPAQSQLLDALLDTGKPVVLVLEGGRPFAIPVQYARAAAVMLAYFPGQAGGQAIADALFGTINPGGRLPVSIPSNVGALPAFYNFKHTQHEYNYTDINSFPLYPFGSGKSYTTFVRKSLKVASNQTGDATTFSSQNHIITFLATVQNTGSIAGSYTAQIYLLGRVSTVVQPVRQLVGFQKAILQAGEEKVISINVDAERYLTILNRDWEWELEKGSYTFAFCNDGGVFSDISLQVSLESLG